MRTIGLIGGMSWESTLLYYRIINAEVGRRRGGLRSAALNLVSLDFEEIVQLQQAGAWDELGGRLSLAARNLQRGGADCVLICTNTMHRVADEVAAGLQVPLLHIADASAAGIRREGRRRAGLIGTRYTMEQSFYRDRLARHGIECVTPEPPQRDQVHRIIFDELCKGVIRDDSRHVIRAIAADLARRGADCLLLACTELCMLVGPQDIGLPVLDTTHLHATAAVDHALADTSVA